jgi:hypothetical protein
MPRPNSDGADHPDRPKINVDQTTQSVGNIVGTDDRENSSRPIKSTVDRHY